MTPSDLWSTYIRPMGAGAVAAAGLITLLRTAPTILSALHRRPGSMGKNRAGKGAAQPKPSAPNATSPCRWSWAAPLC